ncbi:TetR/AcrR family transcriptional regulator [Andreprevotia chitinilytica]|uniref:TetR/AcrR family transcriptional regulator n=1 Tax=Andreprevotia chitinilytica TaxID=396808 RepID=UPI000AA3C279|nr:TetR/AcrR family transcriptional regulator [Andreprevotia chitinilytica]
MQCPISKRWSRRKEARPQEILEAALTLFVDKGFTATRIEDIAREAGVTRGTPYLYFANKEEIFKAVIRDLLLPQITEAAVLFEGYTGSAADLLRELVRIWWQNMGETQLSALPKLMIAEGGQFPDVIEVYQREFIEPGLGLFKHALEYGIARGEFRPVDVAVAAEVMAAPVVMAMLNQCANTPCNGITVDPQTYLATFLDLTLGGLMMPPRADGPVSAESVSSSSSPSRETPHV